MKNNLVLFITLAILVPVLSMSTIFLYQEDSSEQIRSGHFSLGYELSVFVECNSHERWWVTPTSDKEITRFQLKLPPFENIEMNTGFATFRGYTSEKGSFGHLGGFDREFLISEIIDFKKQAPSECMAPKFWP